MNPDDECCGCDKNPKYVKIIRLADIANDYPELEDTMDKAIGDTIGYVKPAESPAVEATATELGIFRIEGKIPAIRAYRERTGCGLKDSKEAIEKSAKIAFGFESTGCFTPLQVTQHGESYTVQSGVLERSLPLLEKKSLREFDGRVGNGTHQYKP